jgi:glycolate oxidase FAD binding subunit
MLMESLRPQSPEELASALREASASGRSIRLGGAFSKAGMAGPIAKSDISISTCALKGVLEYEPRDLTISVEAGMLWADLAGLLAHNRQMIPLDPPFFWVSTVGGVVAANCSGPRRRLYGTARDAIIGMRFATLEGKVIHSGGMVVKNVAGLDMAKLMIGSFGTLAGIATVNFKVAPMPEGTRTFAIQSASVEEAIAARDKVLAGALQPAAIDLLNPAASARVGLEGLTLVLQAGGTETVLARYSRELEGAAIFEGNDEASLWTRIREFTPTFLADYPNGAVVRRSTTLGGVGEALQGVAAPAVARAGTGVVYVYYENSGDASVQGGKAAIEFAPEAKKASLNLWPQPGSDFEVMTRVKHMFDPKGLLNRGRLYGRI